MPGSTKSSAPEEQEEQQGAGPLRRKALEPPKGFEPLTPALQVQLPLMSHQILAVPLIHKSRTRTEKRGEHGTSEKASIQVVFGTVLPGCYQGSVSWCRERNLERAQKPISHGLLALSESECKATMTARGNTVLGLVAVAYGSLNLFAPPGSLWTLFLIAGLLELLERIHPALVYIPVLLLSFSFIVGGFGLIARKPWGRRTVGIAARVSIAVLVIGFLLASASGLRFVPLLGGAVSRLFEAPALRYLVLFEYFGFGVLPAAVPLVPMWLATEGRPHWLRGQFSRVNDKVWRLLFTLSVFSGSVLFLCMWVTSPLTRTANHRLYMMLLFIQTAIYLFTLATSKKWFVSVAMILLVPFVAGSIIVAQVYGACFFFRNCL